MKNFSIIISWIILTSSFSLAQFSASQVFDEEFEAAVQWMYDNDLTRYDNPIQFLPAETLTREQAAKFFWNFAVYLNKTPVLWEEECQFNDVENADWTLKSHIISSCMLWLFKGSQGNFMPFDTLTRAEAMTVVIRTIKGKLDETIVPRWSNYHKEARQLWLTTEEDVYSLDAPISRYEIALILYRASGEDVPNLQAHQSQAQIDELKSLLLTLGLLTQ